MIQMTHSARSQIWGYLLPLANADGWTKTTEKVLVAKLDLPTGLVREALFELRKDGALTFGIKNGEVRNIRLLFEDQRPIARAARAMVRGKVAPVGRDVLDPRNYPTIAEAGPMTVTKTYHARRGSVSPIRRWLEDQGGAGIITQQMLVDWGYSPASAKGARQIHKARSRGQITARNLGGGEWECALVGYDPEAGVAGPVAEPQTLEALSPEATITVTIDMSNWRPDEVIEVLRELRR